MLCMASWPLARQQQGFTKMEHSLLYGQRKNPTTFVEFIFYDCCKSFEIRRDLKIEWNGARSCEGRFKAMLGINNTLSQSLPYLIMMMNPLSTHSLSLSLFTLLRWKAKLSRYRLVRFCNPSINSKWFPFIGFHSLGNVMFSFQSGVTMAVLHLYWQRTPSICIMSSLIVTAFIFLHHQDSGSRPHGELTFSGTADCCVVRPEI